MARAVQDVRLDSRNARQKLKPRKKPYYRLIDKGRHIGYYRGPRAGTWFARLNRDGRYVEGALGAADDIRDANGMDVLSFAEAQTKAHAWFNQQAQLEHGVKVGHYTVSDACDDYLKDYLRRSGKDEVNTRARLERINAALGRTEIAKLKTSQIRNWHCGIAEGDPLTRSKVTDEETGNRVTRKIDSSDPEAKRRRKASANRLLSVLKAALNHAFHHTPEGVAIPSRSAWEAVRPYREADAPKIRNVTDAETMRLLNACPPDFRALVAAALLTGCRYGELCRLRASDFDEENMILHVRVSKAGTARVVALSDEGVAHFHQLAKGKSGDQLLLTRADGGAWQQSHQLRRMEEASDAAKINPRISFHILRHIYASRLAMSGAPMAAIAAQLGHSDTRMTERHYAHLSPSFVNTIVRAHSRPYGLANSGQNVVAMTYPQKGQAA